MAKIVNNTVLNEFIYTLLFKASLEEKRGLKDKYLKIAMNAKAAKTFATTSSREEKEYILTHFGLEYFYVICKRGMPLLKFREILDKFDKKKKVAALSDIAEEQVFVTSDKEFIRLMGLMSQYTHHHSQFMNMELLRQGYHIKKWPKIFANKEDMMSRDIDASAKALARSFLSASLLMDAWPGHTRMNDMQMKMLLYLYSVSHTYVSYDSMHSVFVGHTNNFKFSSGVRALEAAGYILKDGHGGKREYTITGSGIKQVNEFIQRTLNLNTF